MSRIELNIPDGRELFIRIQEEVEPTRISPKLKKEIGGRNHNQGDSLVDWISGYVGRNIVPNIK